MNKRLLWWTIPLTIFILLVLFSIEESYTFIFALALRIFLFIQKSILALLAAFFLVKGKFILTIFFKKISLFSVTGLGKRYLIENVINKNLKIHFLDYISDDLKRLGVYVKENFKDFPLIKQIIAGLAFLGSLGFVGKFMGGMLAMKVFIAKFWSFILVIVLKFLTAIVYFFTDYLWSSWIGPVIEIFIFSWLLEWLEKVPFLKKYIIKIYTFFLMLFEWFEDVLEKVFRIPMKRFFKFFAKRIKKYIYTFIGYTKVSAWKRSKEVRVLSPSAHRILVEERKVRSFQRENAYVPVYIHLQRKRKVRK